MLSGLLTELITVAMLLSTHAFHNNASQWLWRYLVTSSLLGVHTITLCSAVLASKHSGSLSKIVHSEPGGDSDRLMKQASHLHNKVSGWLCLHLPLMRWPESLRREITLMFYLLS